MKTMKTVLLAAGLLMAGTASADLQLAQKQGCLGCHTVDKKLVGPGWKDVANKYRGEAGAEAKLVQKVRTGGKGVWGDIVQPPNTTASDEDLKTLVKFILALK